MVFMSTSNNNVYKYNINIFRFDFCIHKIYSWIQDKKYVLYFQNMKDNECIFIFVYFETELWFFCFISSFIFMICSTHIHILKKIISGSWRYEIVTLLTLNGRFLFSSIDNFIFGRTFVWLYNKNIVVFMN